MSSKRLQTMADYARHHYRLRVECECGRVVLADPHKIIAACQERRISYRLEAVAKRLRCQKCGRNLLEQFSVKSDLFNLDARSCKSARRLRRWR